MIQIDIEKPQNCQTCPIYFGHVCPLTNLNVAQDIINETLNVDCPLKEVPSGKWIPVTEIRNLRKEMSTISRVTDGERDILFTCLAMIDDLIDGYFEEQEREE